MRAAGAGAMTLRKQEGARREEETGGGQACIPVVQEALHQMLRVCGFQTTPGLWKPVSDRDTMGAKVPVSECPWTPCRRRAHAAGQSPPRPGPQAFPCLSGQGRRSPACAPCPPFGLSCLALSPSPQVALFHLYLRH